MVENENYWNILEEFLIKNKRERKLKVLEYCIQVYTKGVSNSL
jgi:hypothetical protein